MNSSLKDIKKLEWSTYRGIYKIYKTNLNIIGNISFTGLIAERDTPNEYSVSAFICSTAIDVDICYGLEESKEYIQKVFEKYCNMIMRSIVG